VADLNDPEDLASAPRDVPEEPGVAPAEGQHSTSGERTVGSPDGHSDGHSAARSSAGEPSPYAGGTSVDESPPPSRLKAFERYPAQIAIGGGVVILALIVGIVFAVDGSSSSTQGLKPLGGSELRQLAATPSSSTTVPHSKSGTVFPASAAAKSNPSSLTTSSSASNGTTPSTTKPTTTATTAAKSTSPTTSPGSAPDSAAVASQPSFCTPSDFTITTSTDGASYSPGTDVTTTSTLVDKTSCAYVPEPAGQYSCPTTIVILSGRSQTYPVPGQAEQCPHIGAGVLQSGATITVKFVWAQREESGGSLVQAPTGQYQAQATWSWSAGSIWS